MSGWTSSPLRSRWGDDDDDVSLSQRQPYWSPSSDLGGTGAAAASSWGNALCANFYGYPGQRCATPVHRPAPLSPLSRSPRHVPSARWGSPHACQSCGNISRTVASCDDSKCHVSACITCRADTGWRSCDACGALVCSRHAWPYSFDERECCGLHLLTADAYYICRACVPELDYLLPKEECREDDMMHGVFYCTLCGRDTCRYAQFCRGCGLQNEVQTRMEMARRAFPPMRLHRESADRMRRLHNACLANDIVQHSYHSSEPQLPEPVVVHVPMRRTGGRRGLTKHARRALPP